MHKESLAIGAYSNGRHIVWHYFDSYLLEVRKEERKQGGAEGEKQKSCQKNPESEKQRAAEAVVVFLPSSLSLAELGLGSAARPSAVPRRRLGPGSGGWHGEEKKLEMRPFSVCGVERNAKQLVRKSFFGFLLFYDAALIVRTHPPSP